jgi:hypothetical protein
MRFGPMTHIKHVHVFVWDQRYLTTDWQIVRDMDDEKEDVYRELRQVACFLSAPQEQYDIIYVFSSYPFIELKNLRLRQTTLSVK